MDNKLESLENFYHEIANISPILKKASDQILIGLLDNGKLDKHRIEHHTRSINELVEIIDAHLTFVNIDLNPELYSFQQPQLLNIHGFFFRISKIFRSKAKDKNININISIVDEDVPHIDVLPIAKVLPYIILDNAVKYSPSYQGIEIEFTNSGNRLVQVSCSSIGPMVNDFELNQLFSKGFRGEIAEISNPEGRGLGLYYLQKICDLCGIKYKVSSNQKPFKFDGNNYSEFKIELEFNK